MIGYLLGTVRGSCIVANKVGYLVHTPHNLEEGSEVELFITTIVREDDISLYGFLEHSEQELFGILRKVPGVGASMALALLRDLGASEVVQGIREGTPKTLARASGVGPKKAASIIATARDLLPSSLVSATSKEATPSGAADLIDTLEQLGFDIEQARVAAAAAVEKTKSTDDSSLLSAALSYLRSGK